MAPSAYLAALLLVGLSCTAAQDNFTSPTPLLPATDGIFSEVVPNDPGAPVNLGSAIDLMSPEDYAGPYNASFYSAESLTGTLVTFGDIPMTPDSWIRVDGCESVNCIIIEFVGYGMPNTTLYTQAKHVKVSMQFGAVVDKNFFPIQINAGGGMACSETNTTSCAARYAQYGCHAKSGAFGATPMYVYPMLHPQDPCYQHVVLETCIQDVCSSCDSQCNNEHTTLMAISTGENLSVPAVAPECRTVCDNVYKPDRYCAPSCTNGMLGDMMCNPECDNAMCDFDGGDCVKTLLDFPGSQTHGVYPGGYYRRFIDTHDADGDMMLSLEEYTGFANMPAPAGADINKDGFLDAFELLSLMGETNLIDDKLDLQIMMDRASLLYAGQIVKLYDMNFDGELEKRELHYLSQDEFDTVNGRGLFRRDAKPEGGISVDDLAHTLFGIYVSLSGRTLSDPPFDNMAATHAVVAIFDNDKDGALGSWEAWLIGFSSEMFQALDADGDKYLTAKELLDMQRAQMAAGCAGNVHLTDRESEVKTKAPLTGKDPRTCLFFMLPDWFYPAGAMSMVQNPPMMPPMTTTATGAHRRLLATGGQTAASPKAVKSVVMSRKSGPVPNHHLLSAKTAKQVPHVNHGRRLLQTETAGPPPAPGGNVATDLDMGISFNVTSDTMPWIVQVQANFNGTWMHACLGALIHPEFVVVSGHCAAMHQQQPLHVIFEDGMTVPSARVLLDPFTDARGQFSMGVIEIPYQETRATVQLHDGAGLDLSECKQPLIAVGVGGLANNPGSFPTMTKQAIQMVDNDDCMDSHAVVNRISAVSPTSVCAKARNKVHKICFDAMDDSLLLASHPEDPSQYVVVGTRAQDGSAMACFDETLPSIYNHVAASMTWLLSLPTLRSKFPSQLLSVEVENLHITDGMEVTVKSGSGAIAGDIKTKCSEGGKYFDDGLGSLQVAISSPASMGYFDSDIKLEFDVSGCGDDIPMGMPGANDMNCERLMGCRLEMMPGNSRMDPPTYMCHAPHCEFNKDWKDVTKDLQAHGKAFTGGLGGESDVNGVWEYRQWMCARDWDVEEQLACNVGPGELSCFRFEEKADVFEAFGRNAHKKIVSAHKAMEGINKEKRGLTVI